MLRDVIENDAAACLAIYRWYVENTVISFEEHAPGLKEYRTRICHITSNYPWLVCEDAGEIAGFAYGSRLRPRHAYSWTAEVTIYMARDARGKGMGGPLYKSLLRRLAEHGYFNAVAVITEPNPQSEQFHRKMGFRRVGALESVGFKSGAWHDVGYWQRCLQPLHPAPRLPGMYRSPT